MTDGERNRWRGLARAAVVAACCGGLAGAAPKMQKITKSAGAAAVPGPPPGPPLAPETIAAPLAKKLKAATALVVVTKTASASAFCINPAGLFVTAVSVVEAAHAPSGKTVTLVVNPGEPNQRQITAKVIRVNETVALLQSLDEDHGPVPFAHLDLASGAGLGGTWNVTVGGVPSSATAGEAKTAAAAATADQCWFYYKPKDHLRNIHLTAAVDPGSIGGAIVGDGEAHVIAVVHLNEKGEPKLGSPINDIYLLGETPVIAVRVAPAAGQERTFVAAVFTAQGPLKAPRVTLTVGTGPAATKVAMTQVGPGAFSAVATPAGPDPKGVVYTVSVADGKTDIGHMEGHVPAAVVTAAVGTPATRPATRPIGA